MAILVLRQAKGSPLTFAEVDGNFTALNDELATATSANTSNAPVKRDGSGNFSAGTITATLNGNASTATTVTTNANLTGDITSVGNATSIATGAIVNADINASAAIVDTKLATISTAGKVSDSALPATISSNITGNAATVTDGVYTNANATITAQHSHQTSNTAIADSAGGLARLEVIGTGGAAFLQFHRPNNFATYFGLDSDNQFKIGGWSYGNASYPILHSANYNSYAPTLGGSGASGTWNINITGTAAAVTTVAAGAVGAYQNARSPSATVGVNGSIAGSNLQTAGGSAYGNPAFGGTWRCMGGPDTGTVNAGSIGLWQRIA